MNDIIGTLNVVHIYLKQFESYKSKQMVGLRSIPNFRPSVNLREML